MLKTKIIRMQKNGQPTLAFEREGHPINVWLPKDSFDHGKIGLIAPIVRLDKTLTGSANPGYHSNIYSFFGKPKEIWFMQVTSIDELWSLIKAL